MLGNLFALKICRRVIFVPVRFRLAAPSGISEQVFCSEILFFWQNGKNCVCGRQLIILVQMRVNIGGCTYCAVTKPSLNFFYRSLAPSYCNRPEITNIISQAFPFRGIGLDSLLSKSQYRASEIMYPITANNTTAYPAEQSALHISWHLRRRSIAAEYRTFGFPR